MIIASPGGREGARAQSTTIGTVLLFGLIIAGATIVVTVGGSGLVETQSQTELLRAENSMTLFDSRAAMVALGDSDVQSVSFGQDTGSAIVREDTGWIRITHTNYTGAVASSDNETIYNASLGKVVYRNGDTKIAYQGGGVWRIGREGEAQMISPPEFHYRGATLTLPVIRVFGSGSAGGNFKLTAEPREQARNVYPNRTTFTGTGPEAPYDSTAATVPRNYTNAIRNGTVSVTVKSEYASGWLSYFEKRTTGTTQRLGPNKVKLTLKTTTGPPGDFQMPPAGDSISAGSIGDGHPLNEFEVTLDVTDNKPHWSFYAVEGNQEFELHVYSNVNPNSACPSTPSDDVFLSLYYYDGDGSQTYESWETMGIPPSTSGINWRCESGDLFLDVDFLKPYTTYYDEIGMAGAKSPNVDDPSCGTSTGVTRGNKYAFHDRMKSCSGSWSLRNPSNWDAHSSTVSYESISFNPGDVHGHGGFEEVLNHYLSKMDGSVDLIAKDGPGNSSPINEPGSGGKLLYDTAVGSEFVTFLHVTENEIVVDAG